MALFQNQPLLTAGNQSGTQQYYQPYYDQMAQQSNAVANQAFTPYSGEIAPNANQYSVAGAQDLMYGAPPSAFQTGLNSLSNAYDLYGGQTNFQSNNIGSTYTPQAVAMFDRPGNSNMFDRPGNSNMFAAPNQINMYQTPNAVQMFGAPSQVQSTYNPGTFGQAQAQQYMNPYTMNVTQLAEQEANRQFAQQQGARDATAAQTGAFGGSRAAQVNQQAQADQNRLLANMTAQGQAQAYDNAQQQFERDRQAQAMASQMRLGAGEFNSNMGLQYGLAGLGAQQFNAQMAQRAGEDSLQQQQMNAQNALQYGGMGLQNQQYNINKDMQYGQLGLQNQQFNINKDMQYGQLGLQNAQYNESQRYNAGALDLQGQIANEQARAQAQALRDQAIAGMAGIGVQQGQLGGLMGNWSLNRDQALANMGNQMWNQRMMGDQANYADYMTQQQWPMQQLEFENSMLRGLPGPTLANRTMYGPGVNPYSRTLGNAGGIMGLLG